MVTFWFLLFVWIFGCKSSDDSSNHDTIRIFLSGDVMLGRGIDAILAHPNKQQLPNGKTTVHYKKIAEKKNGNKFPSHSITSQPNYIWGDLMDAFKIYSPDIKLINLETAITTSDDNWITKNINYRMNPLNMYTLQAINNDNRLICNIANNHILDWGYSGLQQTLSTLHDNNINFCGAGQNIYDALKPAIIEIRDKKTRIFVFGFGTISARCPSIWNATNNRSGIAMIDPYNIDNIPFIMNNIKTNVFAKQKYKNDGFNHIIILSMHIGGNWGFQINKKFIKFSHALIDYDDDDIAIDMIWCHSSHHIKGFEIYKKKPIFYGLGDLINDYEGIPQQKKGRDIFHPNLGFMYFVDLNIKTGDIEEIILKGIKVKNFQINYVRNQDKLNWLKQTINQQSKPFRVELIECNNDQTLRFKHCKSETISKLDISPTKLQYQIDSGIKFMCNNQYNSNGQFLYEVFLKKEKIEIDPQHNDIHQQSNGLYGIGMYYRLNYNKLNNDQFSITQCIQNTIKYIQTMSVPIDDNIKIKGELIDLNTGNTALAMMGMIEICMVNDDICNEHLDQFILWIKGLITMRNYKLESNNNNNLKYIDGVFNKSNAYYDTEAYLAFSRLLKYRNYLYPFIDQNDLLWNNIINIVDGLDEYYIEFRDKDDTKPQYTPYWLIQSWFDRWTVLNQPNPNGVVNNFMNRYIVSTLIQKKLEKHDALNPLNQNYPNSEKCALMEALVDVLHAIQALIDDSQYDQSDHLEALYLFKEDIWNSIKMRYNQITETQLLKDGNTTFHFESRFDGAFLTDSTKEKDEYHIRIDTTTHCVCALMKINTILHNNLEIETIVSITNDTASFIKMFSIYDLMISLGCLSMAGFIGLLCKKK